MSFNFNKLTKHSITCLLSGVLLCFSCGTEIDTGRNGDPRFFPVNDYFYDDATSLDGTANDSVSCFGQAPHDKVPSSLSEFCQNIETRNKQAFPRIVTTLCQEHKLVNLVRPECGWDGIRDLRQHFRVIERSDLDDSTTQEFRFFAAGAVTIPRDIEDYLWAFYEGYENAEFRARLKIFDNMKLSDVTIDRKKGSIDYFVEIRTSAATASFRGQIEVQKLDNGMIAIWDRAVADKRLIIENQFLTLLAPTKQGDLVVAIYDDKVIDAMGNHRIAYSNSLEFDQKRMELIHIMGHTDEQAGN